MDLLCNETELTQQRRTADNADVTDGFKYLTLNSAETLDLIVKPEP
jgi:hypothetical protein